MAQAQQPQGLHSLSTIIKRLEAVTSRLEDVAVSQQSLGPMASLRSPTGSQHDSIAGIVAPGAAGAAAGAAAGVAAAAASGAGSAAGTPTGAPTPPPPPPPPPAAPAQEEVQDTPATKAYEDEVGGALNEFIENSKKVGGPVEEHSALVKPLVDAQLAFLRMASQHQKPGSMEAFAPLLKPQADAIGAIMEAKDKLGRGKEGREWGAAFSVLSEGAPAWGWVQVEPAPAPYVGEMKNAAQFWVDRVIKQFKETNPDALAWARSFSALVDTLQKYVKQWHTTGVVWNPKGEPAPASMPAPGAAPAAPPPPPPAPAAPAPGGASSGGGGGGHAALLASLNKGGAITSGLKKVDPSQQTHKNPELRAAGSVPERSVSPSKRQGPPVKAKPAGFSRAPQQPAKKPPKLELEGNKWAVDNQEDARDLQITDTALHHTVHLFNCKNTVLRVSGKINALTMVNCKKTSVVLDSVVSSVSVTSSPSFEVQITGMCPTVQVDTTDSGNIFLSKECMDTVEVVTSKTSALNISIPAGEDGDFVERPVPEQMRSRVIDGKLVTEIVEHAG